MVRFLFRRMLQAVPVVLGIAVVSFLLLRLAPGDLATVMAGDIQGASPEYIAELRRQFGLDQPTFIQLIYYIKNLLFLDLGFSFRHGVPVATLILDRLAATLLLMSSALALSVILGSFFGLLAATGVNTWRDKIISVLAVAAYAVPEFWVGLMLILIFSVNLQLLPATGMENVIAFNQGWDRVVDIAHHLILPAVTLSMFYTALYIRLMRAAVLEQRGSEYVTTALAKGLKEKTITYRHVVPNAILPVVTVVGVQVGRLLGGSVVVESVFAWPGLGLLAFEALFARDYNLLLGIFFVSAVLVVVVNIVIDIIYFFLDPRISVR